MDFNSIYRSPSYSGSPSRRNHLYDKSMESAGMPANKTVEEGLKDEQRASQNIFEKQDADFPSTFNDFDTSFYEAVEDLVYDADKENELRQRVTQTGSFVSQDYPSTATQHRLRSFRNEDEHVTTEGASYDTPRTLWDVLRPFAFVVFLSYWVVREPVVRFLAFITVLVTTAIADPVFYVWESFFSAYYTPTAKYRIYFIRACTTFVCLLLGLIGLNYVYGVSWKQVGNIYTDIKSMAPSLQKLAEMEKNQMNERHHILQLIEQHSSKVIQQNAPYWIEQQLQKHKVDPLTDELSKKTLPSLNNNVSPLVEEEPPFDYASHQYGGHIIHSQTSQSFVTRRAIKRWILSVHSHPADKILSHSLEPGECWWMAGSIGHVTIKLARPVRVDSLSIGHPSPSQVLHKESIPKQMELYGIERSSGKRIFLTSFEYDIESYRHLQRFDFNNEMIFHAVELRILSNYGSSQYTELYSVRIHGKQ